MGAVVLTRYLRGYVRFSVTGDGARGFFNECHKNGIDLFSIKNSDGRFTAKCLVCDYKKITGFRLRNFRTKIISRHGVRFGIHKYRKRLGLVTGAAIMIGLLIFLSGFVWNIKVTGNERLSENLILQTLDKFGFSEGVRKRTLNISEIENNMMIELCDLSRISINLDGSFAEIIVKERLTPPPAEDVSKASNLVAKIDGQIIKMEITKGKPMINVGSGVIKGQLLVTGYYNDKKENIILEHSSGIVTARSEISQTFELELESEEISEFENKEIWSLELFSKKISSPFKKVPPKDEWEHVEERKRLSVFGLKFPVYIIKTEYRRPVKKLVLLTEEEAKARIRMSMEHYEKGELYGAEIEEKNIRWSIDDGICRATVDYIIVSDIAVQQYIDSAPFDMS